MFISRILFISFLFFAIIISIYVIYEIRKKRELLKEHLTLNNNTDSHAHVHAQKRLDFFHMFSPFLYYRLDDQLNMKENSLFLNSTLQEIFGYHPTLFQNANKYENTHLLFFETLNKSDQNIDKIIKENAWPPQMLYLFTINAIDLIVSKSSFTYTMINYSNKHKKEAVIPFSFLIRHPKECERFKHVCGKNRKKEIYILKSNLQRQQGFYLSNCVDDILEKIKHDTKFVVLQRFLTDPFLINGRKINIRIYILIVLKSPTKYIEDVPECSWYIYQNGFLYYTAKPYLYTTNQEHVITSGYIDREVYEKNPMTLEEFAIYLGRSKYKVLHNNIVHQLTQIKEAYTPKLIEENKFINGHKTALLGCDVAPDKYLNVKIMEINKGPDISYKDERDKNVKYNLIVDMLQMLGLIGDIPNHPYKKNNFFYL